MPADLKELLTLACQAITTDMAAEYTNGNAKSLEQLKADPNIEIRPFPDDVLRLLREIAREVVGELMASDPAAARIGESYFSYLEGASANSSISDRAYLNTRET